MANLSSGEITIRIYKQADGGQWEDCQEDYGLEAFAGFLPAVGDVILEPGVLQGRDRHDPNNRKLLTVVRRVFNPRDLQNYVALIVEEQTPMAEQRSVVTSL